MQGRRVSEEKNVFWSLPVRGIKVFFVPSGGWDTKKICPSQKYSCGKAYGRDGQIAALEPYTTPQGNFVRPATCHEYNLNAAQYIKNGPVEKMVCMMSIIHIP